MSQVAIGVKIRPTMNTSSQGVILFGAGGHTRVVADIARLSGHSVLALVDDADPPAGVFEGVQVLRDVAEAARQHPKAHWCVCIGDNHARETVVMRLRTQLPGATFRALIHPCATVARDARVGEGTVIMAGAVVNPGTRIGLHCIVNTGVCIDHDNDLADFCSLAPGAITGGGVRIGVGAAVGIGACVRHGVTIGEHTVIGAGSVVLADMPASSVAYGAPCRVVRSRHPADRYL
jgi:sugar O-acyltransferase (sialic acid O-acetyltransferase NeuD family)